MHTIKTKKRTCMSITHVDVDFSQLSADMKAQVNASHHLRALLPGLLNKRMNKNTCNKPSTSFYRKYVVRQMIFSTNCIVLKMTYDTRGLTFLHVK